MNIVSVSRINVKRKKIYIDGIFQLLPNLCYRIFFCIETMRVFPILNAFIKWSKEGNK